MNRKPVQYFAADLKKAVLDYHEWHGDTNVQLIGFVCNSLGDPLILTRIKDQQGKKQSCLLSFYIMYDSKWDISEVESVPREEEFSMIQTRMGGDPDGENA